MSTESPSLAHRPQCLLLHLFNFFPNMHSESRQKKKNLQGNFVANTAQISSHEPDEPGTCSPLPKVPPCPEIVLELLRCGCARLMPGGIAGLLALPKLHFGLARSHFPTCSRPGLHFVLLCQLCFSCVRYFIRDDIQPSGCPRVVGHTARRLVPA